MKIRYYGFIIGAILSVAPLGVIILLTEINAPEVFLIIVGIISTFVYFPLQILANLISPDIPNIVNLLVMLLFWGVIGFLVGITIERKNKKTTEPNTPLYGE